MNPDGSRRGSLRTVCAPIGTEWETTSGVLWTVVNERDELEITWLPTT